MSRSIAFVFIFASTACASSTRGFEVPQKDASVDAPSTPATLTCRWLSSPADNCWLGALEDLHACLAADGAAGVMKGDGSSCAYDGGIVVVFDPTYPSSPPQDMTPPWAFSISNKGVVCARFESAAHPLGDRERSRLTTARGTVELRYEDGAATFTCPDGRAFKNPHFHELLGCEPDVTTLPGEAWGEGGSLRYFWLFYGMGARTPNDHVTLFNCKG
jgi:hypothetical protein